MPGHIEPSNRSAPKKTDDGYQAEGLPVLYFVWAVLIIDFVIFYFFCLSEKLGKIHASSSNVAYLQVN